MLHIPILRHGAPYTSVDKQRVPHYRTRETFVEISQANAGLIRRDLLDQHQMRAALTQFTTAQLLAMCKQAGEYYLNGTLPVGDQEQTPEDYVRQLSATTGMPHVLVRKNMKKIYGALAKMESMLAGLTRGLDTRILDDGFGMHEGHAVSFFPRTDTLGVILPSNSPGVHSLWVPAIALKTALVLKPGSSEPWSPYRIVQAMIKAGVPKEAFGYYPADHGGAGAILQTCGRGMFFGDSSSVGKYANDARIELHGTGYSKVVLGDDVVDDWEKYLDVMVASITENGGRSCINASGVWVTRHGKEIAQALAERVAQIVPRAEDDEKALLAPFSNPDVARRVSAIVDSGLREAGAEDLTEKLRGPRLVEWEGSTYLLPTIVHCDSAEHPLANREFLFPFASVVEVKPAEMPRAFGPSLVVSAITKDPALIERLVNSPHVDRLNIGAIPTMQIAWDQPHEGNLFEHLYARRAFQRAAAA
ncbi:MAG: aldehyde dehydrogenase [Acidobacteria bacterium]|nr:aldehyde dehydrogenase [Acidobacteriota bacterium]MBI3427216.1 aldehyde dehydrogenase [Acidobacteriota bacterium]